jgi:hypothetical protein
MEFLKGYQATEPENDRALNPWIEYVQVLLLANEFVFVD